jgi:hypothetical protein
VVHPDHFSNSDIEKIVRAQQLDYIGVSHLEQLRASCKPPVPFYPDRRAHAATTRFLIQEGLESIFRPDKHMSMAMGFVDKPRAKELIESMLLTRSSLEWINSSLRRMQITSTVQAVDYYRFYYFNLDLVDPDAIKAFMLNRAVVPVTNDPNEQRLNELYRQAMLQSERVQSAQMAITPFAGIMSLMRRGIMPSSINLSRIVTATRLAAVIRTDEAVMMGKAGDSRDYAFVVKMMSEVMQEVGEVSEDLQVGLNKLLLKTEARRIPTLQELSDGHHTVDLQPIDVKGEQVDAEPERGDDNSSGSDE